MNFINTDTDSRGNQQAAIFFGFVFFLAAAGGVYYLATNAGGEEAPGQAEGEVYSASDFPWVAVAFPALGIVIGTLYLVFFYKPDAGREERRAKKREESERKKLERAQQKEVKKAEKNEAKKKRRELAEAKKEQKLRDKEAKVARKRRLAAEAERMKHEEALKLAEIEAKKAEDMLKKAQAEAAQKNDAEAAKKLAEAEEAKRREERRLSAARKRQMELLEKSRLKQEEEKKREQEAKDAEEKKNEAQDDLDILENEQTNFKPWIPAKATVNSNEDIILIAANRVEEDGLRFGGFLGNVFEPEKVNLENEALKLEITKEIQEGLKKERTEKEDKIFLNILDLIEEPYRDQWKTTNTAKDEVTDWGIYIQRVKTMDRFYKDFRVQLAEEANKLTQSNYKQATELYDKIDEYDKKYVELIDTIKNNIKKQRPGVSSPYDPFFLPRKYRKISRSTAPTPLRSEAFVTEEEAERVAENVEKSKNAKDIFKVFSKLRKAEMELDKLGKKKKILSDEMIEKLRSLYKQHHDGKEYKDSTREKLRQDILAEKS